MTIEPLGIAAVAIDRVGTFTVQPQVDEFGISKGGGIQHIELLPSASCSLLPLNYLLPSASCLLPSAFFNTLFLIQA